MENLADCLKVKEFLHAYSFSILARLLFQQGGNSYEEMKKKMNDAGSLSQVTVVSDSH